MRAQLPLVEREAGAPSHAGVIQSFREEETEGVRRASHADTVRQTVPFQVQILEMTVSTRASYMQQADGEQGSCGKRGEEGRGGWELGEAYSFISQPFDN